MTQHSFLPPSGAADWSRCSLWPKMNARYPQDDSPQSLEGTAAHWVCAELLAGRAPAENTLAPNGVLVTGEMLDGAELVEDTIHRRMRDGVFKLHIEKQVSVSEIHPDCFGTPDFWFYDPGRAHLEIVDYKFGHGFVDEFWNLQGLAYARGILQSLEPRPLGSIDHLSVSFTIVQPRCYYKGEPVRTHTYRVSEAAGYLARLKAAAMLAAMPEPQATTGPQCEHCPGRHACPTLQRGAYESADYASDRQPHDLSPQAAALELRMLEKAAALLSARVDGLRELTLANLKAGKSIPYYRAEASKGRRQWNVPTEKVITLGQMLGKDLSKVTVITPNQAEKIIDGSVISAYSQIIPGSTKLVAENNQEAARVFGHNSEG